MKNEFPLSRFEDMVVQELKDEVLVCDTKNNQVFCLNQTAGEVWKLCNGKTKVAEISRILSKKLKTNVGEEMVLFSLEQLSNHNLLAEKVSTNLFFAGVSRREVIKRIGLSSMIALPLITSVVMPTAIQAASACPSPEGPDPVPNGCACLDCSVCDSGCCFDGICASPGTCNTAVTCGNTVSCPPGFICCNPADPTNSSTCSACGC